jgi:chromosome segregation ATPase
MGKTIGETGETMGKTLFDDDIFSKTFDSKKEEKPLNRLKNLDEKIANAVSKVKALKEEKVVLERRIRELEAQLMEKNREVEKLSSEKTAIKSQVEDLLNELETLEIG